MERKDKVLPIFVILLCLSALLYIFAKNPLLNFTGGVFQAIASPFRTFSIASFLNVKNIGGVSAEDKLKEENKKLLSELGKQKNIEKDNKAFRDQFGSVELPAQDLLPARIVGMMSFVPGVTPLEQLVIDKGKKDGVKTGDNIVFKNNILGRVTETSNRLSVVGLLSHKNTSFTAITTDTSALGVIKGLGGGRIVLDNVALTEKLEKNDVVTSKGDLDIKGNGYIPGMVVGKIVSINKKSSAVFQSAEVISLVDVAKLPMVFVVIR